MIIAELHGIRFVISDEEVQQHVADFQPLKRWDNRDSLNNLREDILDIFEVAAEDPEAVYDPDFAEDFARTLAMRQALNEMRLLHDA